MDESHYILPRRFSAHSSFDDITEAEAEEHAVAIELARQFKVIPFQLLLDLPTRSAFKALQGHIDPNLLVSHVRRFPMRYMLPPKVSTYLLDAVYRSAVAKYQYAQRYELPFNNEAPDAMLLQLVKIGANPFPLLARRQFTA
jgi:hypothetical protein